MTVETVNGSLVKNRIKNWENRDNVENLNLITGGNWYRTARNFSQINGLLKAELKNDNGEWKEDIIRAPDYIVENQNGKFVKIKK